MVNKRCAWGKCDADSRYPNRYPNIKFIPFAKPKTQRDTCLRWIRACCRPHWQLNVDKIHHWTYICSQHFVDGKPTGENPDPVSADVYQSDNQRKRKLPANRCNPPPTKLSKRAAATALLDLQNVHRLGGQDDQSESAAYHHVGKQVCTQSDVDRSGEQVESCRPDNLHLDHAYALQGSTTTSPGKEREQKAASATPITPAPTSRLAPEKSITPKTNPKTPALTPIPAPGRSTFPVTPSHAISPAPEKSTTPKTLPPTPEKSMTPQIQPPAPTRNRGPEKSTTPKPPSLAAPAPSSAQEKYVVYSLREDLLNTLVNNQDRKQEAASSTTTEVRLLSPGLKYVIYGVSEEKGKKVTWSKEVPENDVISVPQKVFTKERVKPERIQEKNVCCVPGCGQNRLKQIGGRKTFFPFPREESRCKQWIQNCGRHDWMNKSPIQISSQGFLICSDHFEHTQFKNSAVPIKLLVLDAVPTLFKKSRRPGPNSLKSKRGQKNKSSGEAQGRLTDPQNPELTPEIIVEIDYAEDPALHWTTLQLMTEVSPEGGGDGETATTVQSLTAAAHIKVEPMDGHTDPVPVHTPPPHTDWETMDIKAEPQEISTESQDTRTEPQDISTESQDIRTEPQDISTESQDIRTEPQDISTEPLDISTESQDIKSKPRDVRAEPLNDNTMQLNTMRPEPLDIKPEPMYFKEPWPGSGSTSLRLPD